MTQIESEPCHYRDWLQHRAQATGYDFGECPLKAMPPMLQYPRLLRWYSLDRAQRLIAERRLRDRLVEDIVSLRACRSTQDGPSNPGIVDTKDDASKEIRLDARERPQSRGVRFGPRWEWGKAAA